MNLLPRVTETTRERVTQEFDNLGPELCLARISGEMERSNPELLDMARRCARDVTPEGTDPEKILVGFAMFYRLLLAQGDASQAPMDDPAQATDPGAGTAGAAGGSETGDIETGNIETGNIETGNIETGNIETGGPSDADPAAGRDDRMRLHPLPQVTPEVRDALVQRIDDQSPEVFTVAALEDLDFHNPQLLHMAHNFAMRFMDYLGIMQGFALLYMALTLQADADREGMQ